MKRPKQSYLFTFTRPDKSVTRMWRESAQDLAAQKRWFKETHPTYTLDFVEPDWVTPLLVELGKPENEKALKRLQDKCRWEHMGASAVLLEWGDPREWK